MGLRWGRKKGIEEILGVRFRDHGLLRQALTHRSYAHEADLEPQDTNERLEFLGDAVLDVVISDHLYKKHRDLDEGDLTRIRSYLVNMNSLAEMAREVGLGRYIYLSREERADGGEDKASILADSLEALIGAVYLDKGLAKTRLVILRLFQEKMEEAVTGHFEYDYKSRLQELVVREKGILPKYQLSEEGPDHRKTFYATVYVGEKNMGKGRGSSKKEAEQDAAREALSGDFSGDNAR